MRKGTLAERYERTMTRIEQITKAGYEVKIVWECDLDREGNVEKKPVANKVNFERALLPNL
jgi:G:T-mismatch repair DNA endonuclease (very short patch repair protein)